MTVTDRDHSVVERPTSVSESASLLRDTTGALLFRGAGTKQAWGGTPQADLIVETTALTRLLAHNPADMTVAVEAGMALRDLQAALGAEGQWLAFDPPSEAAGATIGGLLATGDSGPRRLRYGGLRDLVIGVTLVLADGTVAHAGGKVIKNVAGYDLTKMLYGSLGTLGFVAEVVLRLHPLPATSATATLTCTVQEATDIALGLLSSPLEPSAVDWAQSHAAAGGSESGSESGSVQGGNSRAGSRNAGGGESPPGRLAVRFEGTAAGVAAQREAASTLLGAGGSIGATSALRWHSGDDEQSLWDELATTHRPGREDTTVASAATLPTRTPEVASALAAAARAAGVTAGLASRPALGLHTASLTGPADAVAAAFTSWRSAVLDAGNGASVLLRERPAAVDATVDALGPAPSSVALLRSVKHRLDPDGRCAPGRLGPWC